MSSAMIPDVVRTYIKFANNRVARDKSLRLVQYFFKLQTWRADDPALAKQYKAWASMLSMHRKLFRIGMWVDEIVKINDGTKKLREQLSKGGVAAVDPANTFNLAKAVCGLGYYWLDMLQWLHHAKMRISPDKKLMGDQRNKLWVGRIVFGFIALVFKYQAHTEKEAKAKRSGDADTVSLYKAKSKLQRDLFKSLLDIWSPTSSLQWEGGLTNGGFVAVTGMLSAFIGCWEKWPATKK